MALGPLTFRLARTLFAGALGALRAVIVLALVLVVGLPALRIAADWYVRGTVDLTPVEELPASPDMRLLPVKNATPAEVTAVRAVVGGLRYRVDPRTVSVVLVDQDPFSAGYAGEYLPYLDLIRLQRSVVDKGGPELRWTVAHEIGHYVDQRYMTTSSRRRFRQLRGIPPTLSWESPGIPWQQRAVEDFAEVFAAISQTSVYNRPATEYGRIGDSAAFETLLRGVGVSLGREPAPRDWQEVFLRELTLAWNTATEPSLERPLTALLVVYLAFGASGPARRAWRTSRDYEGVPLDREAARVLNASGRAPHTGRRSYVTSQGRHHGGGG